MTRPSIVSRILTAETLFSGGLKCIPAHPLQCLPAVLQTFANAEHAADGVSLHLGRNGRQVEHALGVAVLCHAAEADPPTLASRALARQASR
jgi:hypothetical protein